MLKQNSNKFLVYLLSALMGLFALNFAWSFIEIHVTVLVLLPVISTYYKDYLNKNYAAALSKEIKFLKIVVLTYYILLLWVTVYPLIF